MFGKHKNGSKSIKAYKAAGKKLTKYPTAIKKAKLGKIKKVKVSKDYDFMKGFDSMMSPKKYRFY